MLFKSCLIAEDITTVINQEFVKSVKLLKSTHEFGGTSFVLARQPKIEFLEFYPALYPPACSRLNSQYKAYILPDCRVYIDNYLSRQAVSVRLRESTPEFGGKNFVLA